MFRVWSSADGPADLTEKDTGQHYPFNVQRPNGTVVRALVDIISVGQINGDSIRPFKGRLHIDREIIPILGQLNRDDRTLIFTSTDAC